MMKPIVTFLSTATIRVQIPFFCVVDEERNFLCFTSFLAKNKSVCQTVSIFEELKVDLFFFLDRVLQCQMALLQCS